MSKFEKLLQRLLSKPKDFTYNELNTVLKHLNYTELKNSDTNYQIFNISR